DQQRTEWIREAYIVAYAARRRHQRMAETGADERRRARDEFGVDVFGMLEAVGRKACQRFELRDGVEPAAHVSPMRAAPALGRERHVHGVRERNVQCLQYRILARLTELNERREPIERMRCTAFSRAARDAPGAITQQRRFEGFGLERRD